MNTTLYFSLMDKDKNNVFAATVNHVDLFIYDAEGRRVIPLSEVNIPAGKRLRLDPGDYTVVAWANATPNRTRFFTNEHIHWLNSSNNYLLTAEGVAEDGDPLYYAPKAKERRLAITVPPQGETEATAEFRHAHVKIEVTVEGYDHRSVGAVPDPLKMELTDITSRYSFGMEAHGNKVSYIRYAPNTDTEKRIFNTLFHVPLFKHNTATHIVVTNNVGEPIVSPVSLKEILGGRIEIEKLTYIPVKITFDDHLRVTVSVNLPEWSENMIEPTI